MEPISLYDLLKQDNQFNIKGILIPRIQRSYAQGRTDTHATKTRQRFLRHIKQKMLDGKDLVLDFIYGNVKEGTLIPLDGQQRLTTLWLLHWYANARAYESDSEALRGDFSYMTRYSARDFIRHLSAFRPSFADKPSKEIRNQGWFPMDWDNDATVNSMLVMIDAIHETFHDIEGMASQLQRINFYFKNIEEMKMTDDIYIKMNSRGKPLTEFEHVKAELLKVIRSNKPTALIEWEAVATRIGHKFDTDWTDLMWAYRDTSASVDSRLLNYMMFIFHLLIYRNNQSVSEFAGCDYFDLINHFFQGAEAAVNIDFFEKAFDCWVAVQKQQPLNDFFGNYLSLEHEAGKSIPLERMGIDIFGACSEAYTLGGRQALNPRQLLVTLYAFLLFVQNRDNISDTDFRRRIRIVLNLQKNSTAEVVDNPKADAGNRMPAILKRVESIILNGTIDNEILIDGVIKHNFSVAQLNEERQKLELTTHRPEVSASLFALEDNDLLTGRISAVGVENTHLYERFGNLFANCSRDAILCALLADPEGFMQRRNNWIVQTGSANDESIGGKAWSELFHPTENIGGVQSCDAALRRLLETFREFDDSNLRERADDFVKRCEANSIYPPEYYMIKYPEFRLKRYGRYLRFVEKRYETIALWAEKNVSSRAFDCYLKAVGGETYGMSDIRKLDLGDGTYLTATETSFERRNAENDEELVERFDIPQNDDGIDTIDRIAAIKSRLDNLSTKLLCTKNKQSAKKC